MRKFLLSLLVVALCMPVWAGAKKKADKDTNQFRYEIECAGNAIQGTYLVKVWTYSRKAAVAENQCRKNAVHGVIFKKILTTAYGEHVVRQVLKILIARAVTYHDEQ